MSIECSGLTKFYGDFKAVDKISFYVEKGEIFGLLGLNGAGKTTIIKMLTTQLKPSSGAARISGFDTLKEPIEVKKRIGYVPEVPYLYEKLTGREFIRLLGVLRGLDDNTIDANLKKYSSFLDFEENLDGEIGSYSKGMRQKLALLGAIFHEPEVLILDEPNSGLDPIARKKVKTLIRQKAAQNAAVLLSTHITENAEEMCDRIAIIHKGQIICTGSPQEVITITGQKTLEDAFDFLINNDIICKAPSGYSMESSE